MQKLIYILYKYDTLCQTKQGTLSRLAFLLFIYYFNLAIVFMVGLKPIVQVLAVLSIYVPD